MKIIGFDLGHGETALSCIDDAMSKRGAKGIQPSPVFPSAAQTSIMLTIGNEETTWGDSALQTLQGDPRLWGSDAPPFKLYVGFKDKPCHLSLDARQVMQRYAMTVLESAHPFTSYDETNTNIWIGCPSGWSESDRQQYQEMLSSNPNLHIQIVKEAQAAFAYHYNKGTEGLNLGVNDSGHVIFDFGSSTVDVSLAIGMESEDLNPGKPFGASWIDKALLLYTVKNWENLFNCVTRPIQKQPYTKDELLTFLQSENFLLIMELAARRAKECYYNSSRLKNNFHAFCRDTMSSKAEITHLGEFIGHFAIIDEVMEIILNTPLFKIIAQLDDANYDSDNNFLKKIGEEHNGYPVLPFSKVPVETRTLIGNSSWLALNKCFISDCHRILDEKGYSEDRIANIILTGGASRMPELQKIIADAFHNERQIVPDSNPSLSVANGLCCWGRVHYQTEAFENEILSSLFADDVNERSSEDKIWVFISEQFAESCKAYITCITNKFSSILADELGKYNQREKSGTQVHRCLIEAMNRWCKSTEFADKMDEISKKALSSITDMINAEVKPFAIKYGIANIDFLHDVNIPEQLQELLRNLTEAVACIFDKNKDVNELFEKLGTKKSFFGSLFSSDDEYDLQKVHDCLCEDFANIIVRFFAGDDTEDKNDSNFANMVRVIYALYRCYIIEAVNKTRYFLAAIGD